MNHTRQQFGYRGALNNGGEKRYHLSLKKNRFLNDKGMSDKENDSNSANKNLNLQNYGNGLISDDETSLIGSQNYVLRLSESLSSLEGENLLPQNKNTTVAISDSNSGSSRENSPGLNSGKKKSNFIRPTPFYLDDPVPTIIIGSSDSEEDRQFQRGKKMLGMITLDSDDDSVLNTLKIREKVDPFDRLKMSDNKILDSSHDTLSLNSARGSAIRKKESGKRGEGNWGISPGDSSSMHFSSDLNMIKNNSRGFGKKKIVRESSSSSNDEGILYDARRSRSIKSGFSSLNISKPKSSSSNDSISSRGDKKCQISTKPYDSTMKLTKKDAEGIFKGVKLGGNSYWTPKLGPIISQQDSESLSNYSQGVKNAEVINETPSDIAMSASDSEDEIISSSSGDLKPAKTHITRFINPPNQEERYSSLSDRKKNEISHWIMNNTPGSSSSSSIVSESNRNSSFGNSSLERFELKHETPNNRGKISNPVISEKTDSLPRGIERYIYKGKTSVLKNQTPSSAGIRKAETKCHENNVTAKANLPTVRTIENIHIEDCADILDKLYGKAWRNKADAVLTPQTEPNNKKYSIIKNEEETSKTERKNTTKTVRGNNKFFPSSEEDDFDAFAKDIRPNFNSTKKKTTRESFINDKSPSENSSESFYHTALTNPRESRENFRIPKPAPASLSTRRAVAICDSDSDFEDNYPRISDKDLNKKRLSFSDDSNNSSTSEFDPGEIIPPKPKAKRAPTKSIAQTTKSSKGQVPSKQDSSEKRCKSFLASLSATVPIQNCHPQARIYRDSYKNKKEELCRHLFQLYNKEIFDGKLPDDMAIEWNVRMRGTAGFCYNKKSIRAREGLVRSSRIVLATKILDTPDRLRDTLVHEMCHAAAWLINNVSDGHGPFWKGWASRAIKVFPELPPIKRCHDYKIKTKFTYKCTKCGYSIGRHSKSLDTERKRCGYCYGKFELLVNRTTRSGTMQVATPVQTRTPNGFALFVKENYRSVKKERHSIKHAEVMKILGQQFSAVKIAKKSNTSTKDAGT